MDRQTDRHKANRQTDRHIDRIKAEGKKSERIFDKKKIRSE